MQNLFIFLTALSVVLLMVPPLDRWAAATGALDYPDNRKTHKRAAPRIGGAAIFAAFLFSSLVFVGIDDRIQAILAGATLVFATGIIDDLHGLSAGRKFLGQVSGCLLTVLAGRLYLTDLGDVLGFGPIIVPDWLAIAFTVFAVVGVINAINMIDGLDGLAGGTSMIALAAFFLLGYRAGNAAVTALCAALMGGVLGFLKYNVRPARIFMGDAGSQVLGFVLAFLAIQLTQASNPVTRPVVTFVILGLPILDTLRVMASRIADGQNPFAADQRHVHYRLLRLGFPQGVAVSTIWCITLASAVVGLSCTAVPDFALFIGYLILYACGDAGVSTRLGYGTRLVMFDEISGQEVVTSRYPSRVARWSRVPAVGLAGFVAAYLAVALFLTVGTSSSVHANGPNVGHEYAVPAARGSGSLPPADVPDPGD
jgi:UDP-GlcNAc:undecaprenyl-phosphate GlcNAc-1-phosphate transferase